jgi:hypothetical protein
LTVSETPVRGYVATFSGDCDSAGRVSLAPGDDKTCVVTNTFVDRLAQPGANSVLTVKKVVVGGRSGACSFVLAVSQGDNQLFHFPGSPQVCGPGGGGGSTSARTGSTPLGIRAPAGPLTVTEQAVRGYVATFSGDCDSSGQVSLAPGDDKTCVVTNTFVG